MYGCEIFGLGDHPCRGTFSQKANKLTLVLSDLMLLGLDGLQSYR